VFKTEIWSETLNRNVENPLKERYRSAVSAYYKSVLDNLAESVPRNIGD
jgi:hypothetical protein